MSQLEKAARAAEDELCRQAETTGSFLYVQRAHIPGKEICLDGDVDLPALARAVIASLEPDDAMVEAASREAYEEFIRDVRDLEPAWEHLPQSHRDRIFGSQRAALQAALRSITEREDHPND